MMINFGTRDWYLQITGAAHQISRGGKNVQRIIPKLLMSTNAGSIDFNGGDHSVFTNDVSPTGMRANNGNSA